MNKSQAIREVIDVTTDEPVIFTTGFISRIARNICDRASHFYMAGSMGLAADIGIGIALYSCRPVVIVDGDGSLAMNPGCLLTAGELFGRPLVHLVLDDQIYESTGGQEVPTRRVDFCALARAAGYPRATQANSLPILHETLRWELARSAGPSFIHCQLSQSDMTAPPPRIEPDLRAHQQRFTRHLGRVTSQAVPLVK